MATSQTESASNNQPALFLVGDGFDMELIVSTMKELVRAKTGGQQLYEIKTVILDADVALSGDLWLPYFMHDAELMMERHGMFERGIRFAFEPFESSRSMTNLIYGLADETTWPDVLASMMFLADSMIRSSDRARIEGDRSITRIDDLVEAFEEHFVNEPRVSTAGAQGFSPSP